MQKDTWMQTLILSFQSLGVIYGRLSTAPLYVLESIKPGDISSTNEMHELFSFIFWTLTIIPLLKYSLIVLKADDDGEGNDFDVFCGLKDKLYNASVHFETQISLTIAGGPFSLYSLLCRNATVGLIPSSRGSSKILNHEEDISSASSKGKTENKARRAIEKYKSIHYLLLLLALLGACMILSDAVLTPAISGLPLFDIVITSNIFIE